MADSTLTENGQELEARALLANIRAQLVAQFRIMEPRSFMRQRLGEIIWEIDHIEDPNR